ncbi:MAG: hypothetical protein ABIG66_01715 [Candidatus Kerfeldbacteria bacterium]
MTDENNVLEQLHKMIENIETQLDALKQYVAELGPVDELRSAREKAAEVGSAEANGDESIIEGVFDGQNMVGPDGKIYTVPANYASKSKLVEGDIMKLTIKPDGSFIYKQIGPVTRKRQFGRLVRNDSGAFRVIAKNGHTFRLLTASVTYFKGEPGDTVIVLIPEDMDSKWAAVENIIKGAAEPDLDEYEELEGASAELPLGDEMELPAPVAPDGE